MRERGSLVSPDRTWTGEELIQKAGNERPTDCLEGCHGVNVSSVETREWEAESATGGMMMRRGRRRRGGGWGNLERKGISKGARTDHALHTHSNEK